jgi:DNA-directed RNA polymerase alpha subunit
MNEVMLEGLEADCLKHRDEIIVESRKQGATYREIGEFWGISPCRARQVCVKQKYKELRKARIEAETKSKKKLVRHLMLSVRANNALHPYGEMPLEDFVQVATREKLLELNNFGKKSLSELRLALVVEGYSIKELVDDC